MARLQSCLALVGFMLLLAFQSGLCQRVYNFTCPKIGGRNFYLDDVFSSISFVTFNIFNDPSNGGSYQDNSNCKVQFMSGRTPINVFVTFKKLDVESSSTCSYDSICVLNVKWCGTREQEETYNGVVPANNTLTFQFTSDYSVTRPGFEVSVRIFAATPDTTADQPAVLYAPAPFSVFNFETRNQSNYVDGCNTENSDYYQGDTTSYPWPSASSSEYSWGSESSTNYPWNVDESSNTPNGQGDYESTSDNQYQSTSSLPYETYPAFRLEPQYEAITADNIATTYNLDALFRFGPYVVVNITSNSTNAGNYYDHTNFWVQFATRSIPASVFVAFQRMDIQNDSTCSKDFLCVGGLRWCGVRSDPEWYQFVLPVNNQFTIRFHSDSSETRPGFFLQVYIYPTTNDTESYSPTGTYASQQWSVSGFETQTMSEYTDKCLSSSVTGEEDTTRGYNYPRYTDNDNYLSTRAPWESTTENLEGEIRELQAEIQDAQERLDRANYLASDIQRQVEVN